MHKQIMPDTLAPYSSLLSDSTYIFENCLFQDIGYNINENGFVIHGESIANFVAYQKLIDQRQYQHSQDDPTIEFVFGRNTKN